MQFKEGYNAKSENKKCVRISFKEIKNNDLLKKINSKIKDNNIELRIKVYLILHDLRKIPLCPTCKKKLKFRGIQQGFGKHCSYKCSANDPVETTQKLKTLCKNLNIKWTPDIFNIKQLDPIKEKGKEKEEGR